MSESERQDYEKYEKEAEKQEKEHEKDEKTWDEKWRRDPLSAALLAAVLVWAGLVLLADNLNVLARYERLDAWGIVLIGAGLIVLAGVVIRLLVPSYRRPVMGITILGVFLLGAGLGNILDEDVVWPLMLITFGVIILLRAVLRRP
jgi:hypothetical protein